MLNSDPLYKTMQARKNQEKELIIANESLESETTKQMHELSEKKEIFTYLELLNERASEMIQLWNTSLIELKKNRNTMQNHTLYFGTHTYLYSLHLSPWELWLWM